MKKLINMFILIFTLLLSINSHAQESEVFTSIFDEADVLSPTVEKYINTQNEILSSQCGAKIVFITALSSGELSLNEYAEALGKQWGLNSDDNANSVLVLFCPNEHDYTAIVSDPISRALTNVYLEKCLINSTEADFAKEDYSSAAVKTFNAIAQWYSDNYTGLKLKLTEDMSEYKSIVTSEQKAIHRQKISRRILISSIVIVAIVLIIYIRRRIRLERIRRKREARRMHYLRLKR